MVNGITGALAHLQLGRAYVLSGDTAKAKVAYQDFLTLWKDAYPDIPRIPVSAGRSSPATIKGSARDATT